MALQVEKAVKTRRAKLVLLAPNIASLEEAEAEGVAEAGAGSDAGAGDAAAAGGGSGGAAESPAAALAALVREREVPLVFALSRQRMGKVGWVGSQCLGPMGEWCVLQMCCACALACTRPCMAIGALPPLAGQPRYVWPSHPLPLPPLVPPTPFPLAVPNRPSWLPQLLGQRKRASAFAVLDANGVFEELRALLAMAEQGRRQWEQARRERRQQQHGEAG